MDVTKDQLSVLIDNCVYDSAKIVGSFLVSSPAVNADANQHLRSESLVLFGDALFFDREYRRAIHSFKQALHHHKVAGKQTTISLRNSLTSSVIRTPQSEINENEVRFKIARCYYALNETKAALIEMEGIPSKSRNLQMNLMMGKMYRNSRHTRSAVSCYKECLKQCPCVIEAVVALSELRIPSKEITSLFPQSLVSSGLFQCYAEAQCAVASNDYKLGLEIFSGLEQRFPNNVHVLLEKAKVESIMGKNDVAIADFEKARVIDPYLTAYMDEYALVLKSKYDYGKLSKLVHDLVNIDPTRPEFYVAMAALTEKKDASGALCYAEKGTRTDDRNVPAFLIKGLLLLSMSRPEAAVAAFKAAHEIRPDIRSYQGLVRSYMYLSKVKEAMYVSREAVKAMPAASAARALKLVGDAHCGSVGGREKAKKCYESAIRIEGDCVDAVIALAELHFIEGKNGDAVCLLQRYLKEMADERLHLKLGLMFASTSQFHEALSHYHAALRISPHDEAVKEALDRLDKQMKGLDPDVHEEEDDDDGDGHDSDNGDADQEEAELS